MTVNRTLLREALSGGTGYKTNARNARDLASAQSIQEMSLNSANFGSGQARGIGLAAQLATAGIGAYSKYKAERNIAEKELASQEAFAQRFPQYAELASQLSPQTREAYTIKIMENDIASQNPLNRLKIAQAEAGLNKTRAETVKLRAEGRSNSRGKAPTGYRFIGDTDKLEAIPGGPAGKLSAESAGKLALVKQGIRDINKLTRSLKNKDGSFDRSKIFALNTYGTPGARNENSLLFNAINARLRLESGAAVPETEVHRALKTFAPKPLDSDETIQSKLDRMNEFFSSAISEIKTGRESNQNQTTSQSNLDQFKNVSSDMIAAEIARRRGDK